MFFGYSCAGTLIFILIYHGEEYYRRMNDGICVQGTTLIREVTFVQLECEFFWTDDGRLLSSESREPVWPLKKEKKERNNREHNYYKCRCLCQ